MARRRWNSGSRRTAAAPGSAAVTTRTGSLRSMSTLAAREHMAFAWWPGRHRGWATSRRRRAILPNPGSRSTAAPPRFSFSRLRSARESTPARWRSPGEPAIFTCRRKSVTLSWRPDQPGAAWQTDRRCSGERGSVRLDRSADSAPALPSQGRGRRFRRPSRLGGNDRHGPDHGRSQPAPQPDHRPRPQRPLWHRPVGAAVALGFSCSNAGIITPGPAAL